MDPNVPAAAYPAGPVYYAAAIEGAGRPVSVGDWILTLLVSCIPLVGFIMLFVWAFSSGTPPSKANWAKATLLFLLIFSVLGFLFAGSILAVIMKAGTASHGAY